MVIEYSVGIRRHLCGHLIMIDNSDFDNDVGFGQDPNSTPQSFNVRGYTIVTKFIVNYGGDIAGEDGSIFELGSSTPY